MGFQYAVAFLTNFTVESTDDTLMNINAAMGATQGITSHIAVFLKDATLLTQPAARALKLIVWNNNALQALHMGMVAKHLAVFGRSDIELSSRCTFLQACMGLQTSARTYHPSGKASESHINVH